MRVYNLAFSPDGRVLASGDADGITRLWDVTTGALLQELDQGWRVYGLAFRPDGRQLVSAGFDGLIWVGRSRRVTPARGPTLAF